jgi:hypothetical protein
MLEIMKTLYHLIAIFILSALISCTKETASAAASAGAVVQPQDLPLQAIICMWWIMFLLKHLTYHRIRTPVFKSKTEIGINIETIFPYQDKLFIGSSSTMYVYSLSDPTRPTQLGKAEYTIRMSCDPVVARDSVAYATLRSTGRCGGGQSALVVII